MAGFTRLGRRWATAWRLLCSRDLTALTRRTLSFLGRLGGRAEPVDYSEWRRRWVEIDDVARIRIDKLVAGLPHRPLFTLLLPVDGADVDLIVATANSVVSQGYPNWVLCLASDGSPDARLVDAMTSIDDSRVRFTGPSPAPSGAWVGRLAPGDVMYEPALFAVADAITRNPSAAVVYTDHDHLRPDGRYVDPHMKPDWNPELLAGMDYFGILTAYRTGLWEAHSPEAVDPHSMAIRATANLNAGQVVHVPHVLAGLRVSGDGSHLVPDTTRVAYPVPDPPRRVSVLIPTKDRGRMLRRCLSSLRDITDYPDVELVVVDHETTEARARKILEDLAVDLNTLVISFSGPFNFAAMMNRAAEAASGEVLVLLNNDTEVVDPGWLTELVAQVSRPEVGVAGALLAFGDGTIQHAGVHPGMGGLMGHGHKHLPGDHPGHFGRLLVAHQVAAVTGACLAIETATWEELGGLDDQHLAVAYNDIDLCLRARQVGLRVIFTPYARLVHHESVSRGLDYDVDGYHRLERELAVMRDRWDDLLEVDPAYSTNLSFDGGSFAITDPPRSEQAWRNQQAKGG